MSNFPVFDAAKRGDFIKVRFGAGSQLAIVHDRTKAGNLRAGTL